MDTDRQHKIDEMEMKWDSYFKRREKLDRDYWKASARLEDEYDALLAEWKEL